MEEMLVNKVSESGILTLDLEEYYPQGENVVFDMKDYLFMELILKEKDFRESLRHLDLEKYKSKNVALSCSVDAIIPVWAYMLVVSYIEPVAKSIVFGDLDFLQKIIFLKNIGTIDMDAFAGKRVVIKGCGDKKVAEFAYVEITRLLRPVVKSIMYGEPCSTVPIYKVPKQV